MFQLSTSSIKNTHTHKHSHVNLLETCSISLWHRSIGCKWVTYVKSDGFTCILVFLADKRVHQNYISHIYGSHTPWFSIDKSINSGTLKRNSHSVYKLSTAASSKHWESIAAADNFYVGFAGITMGRMQQLLLFLYVTRAPYQSLQNLQAVLSAATFFLQLFCFNENNTSCETWKKKNENERAHHVLMLLNTAMMIWLRKIKQKLKYTIYVDVSFFCIIFNRVYCNISIIPNYANSGHYLPVKWWWKQERRIVKDWQIKHLKERWLCHHFLVLEKRSCYISYSREWMNKGCKVFLGGCWNISQGHSAYFFRWALSPYIQPC